MKHLLVALALALAPLAHGASPSADERLAHFTRHLSDAKIAVIEVHGMICDFCARGIEKIFKKDNAVRKISIDLHRGEALIAYDSSKRIDFAEIKQKFIANGQNAVGLRIVKI